jgi:hypothetical protein
LPSLDECWFELIKWIPVFESDTQVKIIGCTINFQPMMLLLWLTSSINAGVATSPIYSLYFLPLCKNTSC